MRDPLSPAVNPNVPSVARVYDYLLGGKDNFAADRAVGDQILALSAQSRWATLENRYVLARAVRHLAAEAGIDQFLDLGSGLPTQRNVHQVAQEVNRDARVVYVDNDPIVLAHGRALLAENDRTAVVQADMRDPDEVLARDEVTALLDLSRPVGVIMCGVLHHLDDEEDPAGLVASYMARVPSGSRVFVTHFARSGPNSAEAERILIAGIGSGRFRTAAEIEALFGGLDLVEPGVVFVPRWRPDEPLGEELEEWQMLLMGGVAVKP
ncbi:SAM-dependent methyltransferase [Nonomuraea indica]|uniref:SAM-dependent methyltransferase n=1 Tax=Nonomuraea indica TaxID=1581193 RepID=UPI000C7BC7D8|nr:SAM-dependent methyltransferase [Nonomuraea indica]